MKIANFEKTVSRPVKSLIGLVYDLNRSLSFDFEPNRRVRTVILFSKIPFDWAQNQNLSSYLGHTQALSSFSLVARPFSQN